MPVIFLTALNKIFQINIPQICSGYFPYYDPDFINGDGDGTVNIRYKKEDF